MPVTKFRRPDPVLYAIVALFAAAALVVYLQHRDLRALDRQTRVILQKISEQTAAAAATHIRRTFEGPVFETLTAVNHPLLQAGRLELVAQEYAEGLTKYPQVERFFLWHEVTDRIAAGEVLFFDGTPGARAAGADGRTSGVDRPEASDVVLRVGSDGSGSFYRDPPFGRRVYDAARHHAKSQWIYAAVEAEVGKSRYDIFLRLFWTDAKRDRFFAVLGFVVNHDAVRRTLFGELYRRKLAGLLDPGEGVPKLELRVLDESGQVVFGPGEPLPSVVGKARFALQFYPADEIASRMAAAVPTRRWSVAVSPASVDAFGTFASTGTQGYWLSGVSVLLMLAALSFTLQSRKRAAQLAGMQAEFVSHVSHQLKTPLSLLSAVVETLDLERVRSPDKLAQYLQIARTETTRLAALVERILELSRVQSPTHTYELEAVSLAPLVRETVEAFQGALEHEGVTITIEETGPSPLVAADPAALEQVLVNLLDNAVKYSYGRKEIHVRVGRLGPDAGVEVRDRGIGISAEELPRIFDKFYRGSGSVVHRQGFGLGLAIARELVTAHRGRIEVDSAVERGSTFRVRLPLLDKGAAGAGQPALAAEAADARTHRAATPAAVARGAAPDVSLGRKV